MKLQLGYKASAEQFSADTLLGFAATAEELGFDSVAVSDHLQPWRHEGGHAPHALTWLGAATQRTNRIALGTSVIAPTLRNHPVLVAQAAATLASLAPGRVFLGLGSGEALNERALGGEWPDTAERFARLKEALSLLHRLAREDRVTFAGRYFQTRNVTVYDRPTEPVPLFVAAAGPATARLAGRVADGMLCTSGKDMSLYAETLLPAVRAGARAAGRDPGSVQLIIEMKVAFDRDIDHALDDTRQWAALALSPEEKRDVDDPLEMERRASALPRERVAARWIVSSDPDEHVARIQPYLDLGFRHLIFHAPGADQLRFLEQYAEQVIPRLRALQD